ncbi:MAG: hypothetical protein K2P51_07310 [Rhabdochlamydiaceae bacterium]|nr:hypothetical protein [Rhabdochlamydiaceae bacterium]
MASFSGMRIEREKDYVQKVEHLDKKAQKKWSEYTTLLKETSDESKIQEAYIKVRSTLRAIQNTTKEFHNQDQKKYRQDSNYIKANRWLKDLENSRTQDTEPVSAWQPQIQVLYASYKTEIQMLGTLLSVLKSPSQFSETEYKEVQIAIVKHYNVCTATYHKLQAVITRGKRASIIGKDGKPTGRNDGIITKEFKALDKIASNMEKIQVTQTNEFITLLPQAGFLEEGLSIDYGSAMVSEKQRTRNSDITALPPHAREYPRYRKIKGDGNCFYTAFILCLLQSEEGKGAFAAKLLSEELNPSSKEASQTILDKITSDTQYAKTFWEDNDTMLCLCHYLRHVAADWMSKNPDHIQLHALAEEVGLTIDEYLETYVQTMGVEAEEPIKIALSYAFNFPTLTLDLSNGKQFPSHEDQLSLMTLARDGEHYFALFRTRD